MSNETAWAIKHKGGRILLWSITGLKKGAIEKLKRNTGMKWQELKDDFSVVRVRIEECEKDGEQ